MVISLQHWSNDGDQKTRIFHLPHGECTVTLQDVFIQLGLSIDGQVVAATTQFTQEIICEQCLGAVPPRQEFKGFQVNLTRVDEFENIHLMLLRLLLNSMY